ncbi:ABC transporter ATP-binding protein [Pseudochelatococcus lubricantis]|uniref:ABC transporter ATP-binding protein n=1 Tax=Pseudochelatococcus lubricantis TaxID=1538102 RepID=UPI0035EB1BE7
MNAPFGHAPSAARIDVHGLAKTYPGPGGGVLAIKNVDIFVEAGEFVTILGPSGCGKSSLLNILAGFEQATGGTALIGGREIHGPRHGQGVVFQDTAALFPWLSVHDNVAFGLMNTRLTRRERDAKVRAALATVGLEQFSGSWPHQLSGGMRQLASIARVLVTESRVLLMDEPFAALDALTRQQMQQKLLHIWQATGVSIVLITHSVDEAIYLGNRVYILTRRPAEVAAELSVDLPYPREVTDSAFNRLKSIALKTLGL